MEITITSHNPEQSVYLVNLMDELVSRGISVGYSNSQDVHNFHSKFGVPMASTPSFLNDELFLFRKKFLEEELYEFVHAHDERDIEKAADGLVDLSVVTLGTAHLMGLPWTKLWNRVHKANMAKVKAKSAEESKRGYAGDIIKPHGWTPPRFNDIFGDGPWPVF